MLDVYASKHACFKFIALLIALFMLISLSFYNEKIDGENSENISLYPHCQEIHPGETAFFLIRLDNIPDTYTLFLDGLPQNWTSAINSSNNNGNEQIILSITPPLNSNNVGLVNLNLIIQSDSQHTIPFAILFSNSNIVLSIPQIIECSPNITLELPIQAYNRLGTLLNFTITSQNMQAETFTLYPHETRNIILNITSPSNPGISTQNLTISDDAGGIYNRTLLFDVETFQETFKIISEEDEYFGIDSLNITLKIQNLMDTALNLSFTIDAPQGMVAVFNENVSLMPNSYISEKIIIFFTDCTPGKYSIFINITDRRTYSISYQIKNISVSNETPYYIDEIEDSYATCNETTEKTILIHSKSAKNQFISLYCSSPWNFSFSNENIDVPPLGYSSVTLKISIPQDEYKTYTLVIFASSGKYNISRTFKITLQPQSLSIESIVVHSFPGNVLPIRFQIRNNENKGISVSLSGTSSLPFVFGDTGSVGLGNNLIILPPQGSRICEIIVTVPQDYALGKTLPCTEYISIICRNSTSNLKVNTTIVVVIHNYSIGIQAIQNFNTTSLDFIINAQSEHIHTILYYEDSASKHLISQQNATRIEENSDFWTVSHRATQSGKYVFEIETYVSLYGAFYKFTHLTEVSIQYVVSAKMYVNGSSNYSFSSSGGWTILEVRNSGTLPLNLAFRIVYLDNTKSWLDFPKTQFKLNYSSTTSYTINAKPVYENSRARIELVLLKDIEDNNIDNKSKEVLDSVLLKIASKPKSIPLNAIIGIVVAASFATTALFSAYSESGRYGIFKYLGPIFLYSRLDKRRLLDNDIRRQICKYIEANPGDHYSSIKVKLKLKNGVLAHHLRKLEEQELIKSRNDGIYKRFYPYRMRIPTKDIDSLTWFQLGIYNLIKEQPGISQAMIAKQLGESKQVVHYHIKLMEDAGVILVKKAGISTKCYINSEDSNFETN